MRWDVILDLLFGLIAFFALLFVFMIIADVATARSRCDVAGATSQYDRYFQHATKRHWPVGSDWCRLKAQAMAESNLKADAVSPVGAQGVLQVMPGTARDVRRRIGGRLARMHDMKSARQNIEIGAAYMAQLFRVWSYPRSTYCRWRLATASYNAGPGNIIKAQTESGGRSCWKHIASHLHKVTGRHAEETLGYQEQIVSNLLRLKGIAN